MSSQTREDSSWTEEGEYSKSVLMAIPASRERAEDTHVWQSIPASRERAVDTHVWHSIPVSHERAEDTHKWQSMYNQCLVDINVNPTYVVLDLGCTRSRGSRKAVSAFAKKAPRVGIWIEYIPCDTTFIFTDSKTGEVKESCIVHFPTRPPCSTQIDILEKGALELLYSKSSLNSKYCQHKLS